MIVRFTRHAEGRFSLRKISKRRVEEIISKATHRYYDVLTRHLIAVESLSVEKALIVAYQEFLGETWVITAHPITKDRITARVRKGRWVKT